jgi:hypothetical protein
MIRATSLGTSGVMTPEFAQLFGTAEKIAEESEKGSLRGQKPIDYGGSAPGLKPRPPKEKDISRSL